MTTGEVITRSAPRRLAAAWSGPLARLRPALVILAVQQVLFPMPLGVVLHGAIVGGLTALIALGMALTYRSDRVVSFAQGDMGMAPAVLAYLLLDAWGWPWPVAVATGLVAAALAGAVVEVAVIRRFAKASRLLLAVVTIGLAQVLAGVAMVLPTLFDTQVLATIIPPPFDLTFTVGQVVFSPNSVLALIAVPVAVLGLLVLLQRSDVGLAVRAAADRSTRAALLGVPVARLRTVVWAVAGALAFAAVFLRASVLGLPVGPALSLGLLLRALAALLIGRMSDLVAVAAGAVALGILETGVAWEAPRLAVLEGLPVDVVLAAVIAAALLLRRRASERAELDETSSWLAAADLRPVPERLARLPAVRALRLGGGALLVGAALLLPNLLSVQGSLRASAVLIYAILGLSVVVLTGWAGQVSLGQVALFAVGSATGAVVLSTWEMDLLVALPVAAAAGAGFAVVIGFPALRLRGLELAVITLAASLATTTWLLNRSRFDWVPDQRVPRPPLLGRVDIDSSTRVYVLVLVVLAVVLVMLRGVRASRTGRALRAMRDNERAGQAYGLSPLRVRLTAFAISGALAGVAGCLFAVHQQAFGMAPYAPVENLAILTMVVVGGVATPLGALLGALWFQGIRWFLPGEWQILASGAGVVLVLMLVPSGLGGQVLALRGRWLGWLARRHGIDAPGFTPAAPAEPAGAADGVVAGVDAADGTDGPDGADIAAAAAAGPVPVPAEAPLLSVRALDAGYGGLQVLFAVDLDVAEGEIVALLGTNGAGKSTLLGAITGVVGCDRGSVVLRGRALTGLAPNRVAERGVALMPGGAGVFPSLTVAENLRVAGWLRRRSPDGARQEAEEALAELAERFPVLRERAGDPAGDLSGGQQQVLALAMSLAGRPDLLLVDELSLGLAPAVVAQLLPLLTAATQRGTTVVLVEQSVDLALAVADRAVFLEKGTVRFTGPAADLQGRTDLLRAVFLPSVQPGSAVGAPGPAAAATNGHAVAADPGAVAPALATEELGRSFGGNRAVRDVTLQVAPGEILGIIGANGAGKTTLFDLISGHVTADAGRVLLAGADVTGASPARRARAGLGRSFQDARLFPSMTVEESIAVACERWVEVRDPVSAALHLPRSFDSEERVARRAAELVELVGLGPHRSKLVRELSTGTRRIVDLACLLAHRPGVILLDEPSSGVAQREVEALAPLLRHLRDETGASLLIVEHDIALVSGVADRLVALDQGAVVADGEPDEVLADPAVVAAYLGGDALAAHPAPPVRPAPQARSAPTARFSPHVHRATTET